MLNWVAPPETKISVWIPSTHTMKCWCGSVLPTIFALRVEAGRRCRDRWITHRCSPSESSRFSEVFSHTKQGAEWRRRTFSVTPAHLYRHTHTHTLTHASTNTHTKLKKILDTPFAFLKKLQGNLWKRREDNIWSAIFILLPEKKILSAETKPMGWLHFPKHSGHLYCSFIRYISSKSQNENLAIFAAKSPRHDTSPFPIRFLWNFEAKLYIHTHKSSSPAWRAI